MKLDDKKERQKENKKEGIKELNSNAGRLEWIKKIINDNMMKEVTQIKTSSTNAASQSLFGYIFFIYFRSIFKNFWITYS